jgi:squalene-hopene/tetraprenyl-beta-curcumene cyclase
MVLRVLSRNQPSHGGFHEAAPLNAFVFIGLATAGLKKHSAAQKSLEFLITAVRQDGSWPIDTNLATWLTTLSVNTLPEDALTNTQRQKIRSWLLAQQFKKKHPFTNAAPGGWAWTDLPGGTPDADDTAGAILALKKLDDKSDKLKESVTAGIKWLIAIQNRDGGVPTFCRGWGKLPFDRSSPEITAHALEALLAWKELPDKILQKKMNLFISKCLKYLERNQKNDGSWIPLWFGNQSNPDKTNPVYGTSRVLKAIAAYLKHEDNCELRKSFDNGCRFLRNPQNSGLSIEESALSAKALMLSENDEDINLSQKILADMKSRIDKTEEISPAPIGLYFASLWYSEKLYPLIFAIEAMTYSRNRD